MAVTGRSGVSAPKPRLHRHCAVAHVLDLEEGCSPAEPQRFPSRAATKAPGAGGRGFDCCAEEDERFVDLPRFKVAHVALRVEHRGRVVEPIGERLAAAANARHREVCDRGLVAVLVDAAALEGVGRHRVRRQDLLEEAAREEAGRESFEQAGEARNQEAPRRASRGLRVLVVRPRAGREVGADRVVRAVVDLVVGKNCLRQQHPECSLHP